MIGGGASGLSATYQLMKQGFTEITIFEKDTLLGGVTTTERVDGKDYDMAIMFVVGSCCLPVS